MASMDEDTKYNLELLRALDKLIAEGQWEGSLFFQAAGKKLKDLSEKIKHELQLDIAPETSATEVANLIKQHSGLIEIYISLYCAEGGNIRKWEIVLASLAKQLITRPIYKREKDVKDTIHAKENPINDAYAVAFVTEDSILKPSFRNKPIVDRFGHELITLKENALKPENVTKFIHLTGEYSYQRGLLSKL